MKKKLHILSGVLLAVAIAVGFVLIRETKRTFAPEPLHVINASSLTPELANRFNAYMDYPTNATSVHAYSDRWLRSTSLLRFETPDLESYNSFRNELLSSADFAETKAPALAERHLKVVGAWWNLAPNTNAFCCGSWVFGFDDSNQQVYVHIADD